MSRPYKEVIFYNNLRPIAAGASFSIKDYDNRVIIGSEDNNGDNNKIYKLWGGSIQQFIDDFELPQDFINYYETTSTDTAANGVEILTPSTHNTINFKVNLEFWFRLSTTDVETDFPYKQNWAPCSNITFNITCPNFLSFKAGAVGLQTAGGVFPYNPNLFPIIFSNSTFVNSNKQVSSGYNGETWGGLGNGVPFLVIRYNVDGNDIQLCLLSKDATVWDKNNASLILTRASLTFLGFNSLKEVSRK